MNKYIKSNIKKCVCVPGSFSSAWLFLLRAKATVHIKLPNRGVGRVGDAHFLNICIFSSSFVLLLKAEFWTNGSGAPPALRLAHTHTHTSELPLSHTHTLSDRIGTMERELRRILERIAPSFISPLKGIK